MTTAIDTNVIIALWHREPSIATAAERALDSAFSRGALVVAAPVFAELLAAPGRTERFVVSFLEDNAIGVDWDLGESVWRSAGKALQSYAERRHKQRDQAIRRLLVDFIIGAHAEINGYSLLTMDERHFRAAFPAIKIKTI